MRVPDIRRATTCVQATSGIDPTGISRSTRGLRSGNRDLPARTGRSRIEQGKQLRRATNIDCGTGRLSASGGKVATADPTCSNMNLAQ